MNREREALRPRWQTLGSLRLSCFFLAAIDNAVASMSRVGVAYQIRGGM